ncbi:MAG: thiol:disulfide interchange protein DsbA/DsbL [Betaproteobacteria bacterium]|nr:thiol:disulfide interchange protein DsbA/DsbL [Betaproteobacteria bacterium]
MAKRARRRGRFALCVLALALVALPLAAQQPQRDVDYRLIPQQPVATGERVEVIEFFFYACPYCNELEPLLERWRKRKPADIVFRRVPVVRHDSWVPLAKTYYALEAMGEAERLHAAVYHGIHVDDLALSQEKVLTEWLGKQGLDHDQFMAIYRSDAIREKVELSRRMTIDYEIKATPTLVVDGRFLTSSGMTDGVPRVIPVLDGLISLARQRRLATSGK